MCQNKLVSKWKDHFEGGLKIFKKNMRNVIFTLILTPIPYPYNSTVLFFKMFTV